MASIPLLEKVLFAGFSLISLAVALVVAVILITVEITIFPWHLFLHFEYIPVIILAIVTLVVSMFVFNTTFSLLQLATCTLEAENNALLAVLCSTKSQKQAKED